MAQPGVYVHVPFCAAICTYCNFNRGLHDAALSARFAAAAVRELAHIGAHGPADTLYFGGGTPSLLEPEAVGALVAAARASIGLTADAEITLEANPESVTVAALEGFLRAGVNRLSFGVQSFGNEDLAKLGRQHSAHRACEAVHMARLAGFDNVSVDLMLGLPGQTLSGWIDTVNTAVELEPEHVSLYILEVYPHLPLKDNIVRYGWPVPDDEGSADMYEAGMAHFDASGYEQYEISNVCRPGRASRHNLKYWTDGEWHGVGPGAHSTAAGVRWRNVSSTEEYVRRIEEGASVVAERRVLTLDEQLGDAMFTGLRLAAGIDLRAVSDRYATDVWERFGGQLTPFLDAGLLLKGDGRLRLSRRGMLLANDVMSVFV